MYTLAEDCGIAEVVDTRRAYRDFIIAIEKQAPVLAQMSELMMESSIEDHEVLLFQAIEKFRHYIRLRDIKSSRSAVSNATVAADEETKPENKHSKKDSKNSYSSFKGKEREPPVCLCGVKHYYSDCDYLRDDRPGRSSDFKPDPAIEKKIYDKLKDQGYKEKIERAIDRRRKIEAKENTHSPYSDTGSFTVFSSAVECQLRSSWILDHSSAIHVCNNTMKDRFIKEVDCTNSFLIAGIGKLPINALGKFSSTSKHLHKRG